MKRKYSLLLLNFVATSFLALSTANAIPTWAESYGLGGYDINGGPTEDPFYGSGIDFPRAIAPMPDGGFVVAGELGLPRLWFHAASPRPDAALVRFASDGTILWQITLHQTNDTTNNGSYYSAQSFINRMKTDAQGNIFIAGGKGNTSNGGMTAFVAKFSAGGDLIWQNGIPLARLTFGQPPQTLDVGVSSTYLQMALTNDGGVVITADESRPAGYSVPVMAKFSGANGAVSFFRALENPDQYAAPPLVAQSADGSHYILAFSAPVSSNQNGPIRGLGLSIVDASSGNILAQHGWPALDDINESPVHFLRTADGGFASLSVRADGSGIVFRKFNAAASATTVERLIKPAQGTPAFYVGANTDGADSGSFSQTPDGGYLIGGFSSKLYDGSSSGYDAALMKLQSDGSLAFVSLLGGPGNEGNANGGISGAVATPLSDGGYGLATTSTSYTTEPSAQLRKPDWWLVKADANRIVHNFTGTMFNVPLNLYAVSGSPQPSVTLSYYSDPNFSSTPLPSTLPDYLLEDLGGFTAPDKPTLMIQAASSGGGEPAPTPPPHNGLSNTTFTVNGSNSASANVANTALRFAAQQNGLAANLKVRVQATTTPNTENSWTDLNDGKAGQMTFDESTQSYVLNSKAYPAQNGVYFRAISSAGGYPDSISNVVGPFNLASATPRIGSIHLDFIGNGSAADLYFHAKESNAVNGISLRVQVSTTPKDEGSWTDLSNGNSGIMTQSTLPKHYLLLVNNYPTTTGAYFRAIASAPGYLDSISNVMGPYDITSTTAPKVKVNIVNGLAGSGDGHDADHPVILDADNAGFAVTVQSDRALQSVKLQVDGATVSEYPGGDSSTVYLAFFTPTIGDHVYEAMATNDLGATARAGTGAVYVRVIPAGSTAKAQHAAGSEAKAQSAGQTFTASRNGDWNDPQTWTNNADGSLGIPGQNDVAIIGAMRVSCSTDIVAGSVYLSAGGVIVGPGTLDVYGTITLTGGSFENAALDVFGTCNLFNTANVNFGGTLINHGAFNVHGSGGLIGADTFHNDGVIKWLPPLQVPPNANVDPLAAFRIIAASSAVSSGLISGKVSALITNDGGSLITNDGGSLITNDGGSIVAWGTGAIISNDGASLITNDGGSLITNDGGSIVAQGAGNVLASGLSNFRGQGKVKAESVPSPFLQSAGETDLSTCNIVGGAVLNGGVLSGTGLIQGDLVNAGGYIMPGHSAGAIGVTGNFSQGASGTLILEIAGPNGGQFDNLQVEGAAALGGRLDVTLINGYAPNPADTFNPLVYQSVTGSFTTSSANAAPIFNSTGTLVTVDASKPNPKAGQAANISTRLSVQSGDNVMIAGFVITGPGGSTKKVLIRGLGPTLGQFGVPGVLSDPFLELHQADGSIVTNDSWRDNAGSIPPGYAPASDLESAIVADLAPGNYTAVVKGAHGETGNALAEVYDLDTASAAKLGNISTRGVVQTGDNVMIGGIVVSGSEPAKILVRALGPTLGTFGVPNSLANPTLELHDSNGNVFSNDDWRNDQEAAISASGFPPPDNHEAAILVTLAPGSYTAIVRAKNNATGVALVEAYDVSDQ